MKRARTASTMWACGWTCRWACGGIVCLVLAGCANTQGASNPVRDAASFGIPAKSGVAAEAGQALPAWDTFVLDPAIRDMPAIPEP